MNEWKQLATIFKEGNMADFWKAYADYLERHNIISNARIILHAAAQKTVKELEELEAEVKRLKDEVSSWANFHNGRGFKP